jgi:Flp pilus assembly protein TadB
MRATARATCPSRCLLKRSVLRRSWPKLENQELVRSTGQRRPRVSFFVFTCVFIVILVLVLALVSPLGFLLAQTMSVTPQSVAALGGEEAVVASVQVQGLQIQQEPSGGDGLQGGFE